MKTDTAVVSTRLPQATANRISALADATGRTLSEVLRDAVRAFLHPPATLFVSHSDRIRLLTPALPAPTVNGNPCVQETLSLTCVPGLACAG